MINRSSFIKPLVVVMAIGVLAVGCGPNVEMIKKQAQKDAKASFETEQTQINADKTKLQQQIEDANSKISEKEIKIKELEDKRSGFYKPQGEETERGLKLTSGEGWFKSGTAELLEQAGPKLEKLAKFLQYNSNNLLIVGHTDSRGNEEKNQELSEQRANAVGSALAKLGVAEDRFETKGAGQSEPIGDNNTDEGRKQNRRVEITILN